MTDDKRKQILHELRATDGDVEPLLGYVKNRFSPISASKNLNMASDEHTEKWNEMRGRIELVCRSEPNIEIFDSAAGAIPVVNAVAEDFDNIMSEIIFKDRETPSLENMGASFVSGKSLRFIVLSDKPYSGISAEEMGFSAEEWAKKSMEIRKHHECTHYYTKQFFGSARNNLHDELIADFCGIHAAFRKYRAEWFIKFFERRLPIYTKGLSEDAQAVVLNLAKCVAKSVERWSNTQACQEMCEAEHIKHLAGTELLAFVDGDIPFC
ncbi:MAG: hypothetical protein FWC13_12020 [Oscillospiraceae bacterium]|nr:hypothetical protein [Oscillospiraceae bacterium]